MKLFKTAVFSLVIAVLLAACSPRPHADKVEYTLVAAMRDGKTPCTGRGGSIDGDPNPDVFNAPPAP